MKCTMHQLYKDPKAQSSPFPLCFNEWKYFSIKIPHNFENSSGPNDDHQLDLELIFFEQDTRVPRLIGKNGIKLLDILNKTAVAQQVELRLKRQVICKLELDLVIAYGSLGYGYSHQLIHPKKSLDGVVERSIFLRCLPPDHRKDSHFNVITPRPVPYTDFVAALLKRGSAGPSSSLSGVPSLVMEMLGKRGRILLLHEAMEDYQSAEEEVKFLEKLVMRKGPPSETTWRMNKTCPGLSKWKTAATLISNVTGFAHLAKQDMSDDGIPMTATTVLQSVPALQDAFLSWEDESQDSPPEATMEETDEKPPSPLRKTGETPTQSSPMSAPDAADLSLPPTSPTEVQPGIAPKSTTTHKPALQSAVACSGQPPGPPQSSSPPRHVTAAPPEKFITDKTKVTFLAPHPTSLYDLTAVEEVEEEEKFGKQRDVMAPVSALLHVPAQKLVMDELLPQCDPAESRQESPAEWPSDGELRQTQTNAAGMKKAGGKWEEVKWLASVKSAERNSHPHYSEVLQPRGNEVVPPRLLGAWSENPSTEPSTTGRLDRGLLAALQPSFPHHQLGSPPFTLVSPPTIPPSNPCSSRLQSSRRLPSLSLTPSAISPDIKTQTMAPSPWIDGTNHPSLQLGESSSGLGSSRTASQGPGTSNPSNEYPSLLSWLRTDNATGTVSSTPWSLGPEVNMTPLHSSLVFPLVDPNSIPPASPSMRATTSHGRIKAYKAGKDRPKTVDSPHRSYPYERPSRDKYYYGKM